MEEEALAREEAFWAMHHATTSSMSMEDEDEDDKAMATSAFIPGLDAVPQSSVMARYSCDVCGETFFSIVQLAKHRQFHDQDRPYACRICGKRFLSRSHHFEHQRVHTGERPFPCDRCERCFTTHHNLKRHMAIHAKEEMYRCEECGKLFCQVHEYKASKLRSPAVVIGHDGMPHVLPNGGVLDDAKRGGSSAPGVSFSMDYQMPYGEDESAKPSAGELMLMSYLQKKKEEEKSKKKPVNNRRRKAKKKSLLDASRNIAALPMHSNSPPVKLTKYDTALKIKEEFSKYDNAEDIEGCSSEVTTVFLDSNSRKANPRQRKAYDIEVII